MNQDSNTIRQEIIYLKKKIDEEERINGFEKKYFPLLTELQRAIVRLFESYGITQICLLSTDDEEYHTFFRIRDKEEKYEIYPFPEFYSQASRECCQSSSLKLACTDEESPEYDDFECFDDDMMALFETDGAMEIVNTIDRYKELGIPRSEWHKAIDLSKYAKKS